MRPGRMLRCTVNALVLAAAAAAGQAQQVATQIRPESVRAHEEFLASDVLAGRGSATRDEEIAATYVASRFISYGLKPAPGTTGYLQSAAVEQPVLNGHATLTVGAQEVREGSGLTLLVSTGADVHAPLRKLRTTNLSDAKDLEGAALLLTDTANLRSVRLPSVRLILLEESDATKKLAARFGGATRIRMRLKESPGEDGGLIVVSHAVAEQLGREKEGTPVTLAVHPVPDAAPRKTFNAIGYLPGSDASSGTILLTAHLDHLGIGKPVDGDAIYNGANDDAAGTTAVLELAQALAAGPKLRRNVLFVCYGSEEAGELGSEFFGEHPPLPLKDLIANLEFEMIGTQDPKMPKGVLLLTGWDRSNLGPTLKEHGAQLGPDPYPEEHFFERSDNYQLALKGVVAHTAAGWGTPPTYHQPSDDLAHLDLAFMTAAIQSLVEPIRWLATSDFRPAWNPGGRPTK